jgi:hypothetical protein
MATSPFDNQIQLVADPLRDETRKVRRATLVWSLVAVAMTIGGLFPTEISALGLKVARWHR